MQACEINQLSDRVAMGLPEHFSETALNQVRQYYQQLIDAGSNCQVLIEILMSDTAVLAKRYAAGQLLALLGDLRLDAFNPSMVLIPAATATLGINPATIKQIVERYGSKHVRPEWIAKEAPSFRVSIKAFYMAKYPVTNQEYRQFLLETRFKQLPSSWQFGVYPWHQANHPVYTVTEEAAEAYAEWLSSKTGRRFRLPTEAEWEYAAGGREHFEFPWGNQLRMDCCNTVESNILTTTAVGLFACGRSPFGLYDMAGNVEEYVADDYKPYPNGDYITDDLATSHHDRYRVTRGGSFARYLDLARTTRRHGRYDKPIYAIGFRLAEDCA